MSMRDITRPRPSVRAGARPRRAVGLVAVVALTLGACGDDAADEPSDAPVDTGAVDEPLEFDDDLIVGLPVDEAEQVVVDEGFAFRIAVLDGEDQALTMDFVPNRVNVAVDDGVVTGVEFVG